MYKVTAMGLWNLPQYSEETKKINSEEENEGEPEIKPSSRLKRALN